MKLIIKIKCISVRPIRWSNKSFGAETVSPKTEKLLGNALKYKTSKYKISKASAMFYLLYIH